MKISDHRGFEIQVHREGDRFYAEIYRKEKLIYTVDSEILGGSLRNSLTAVEAAKEWIDKTYPKGRIKYFGEV